MYARYALLAGGAFFIFYIWRRRQNAWRKIQSRDAKSSDVRRELTYSVIATVILFLVVASIFATPLKDMSQLYFDIDQYGWVWIFASVPIMLLIHDAYFYWMHRAIHHPKLYKHVHKVHHLSVNPTPWAAYAFHPLEAFLEVLIFPILIFLLPLHPISILTFAVLAIGYNVYGHLGYELYPRSWHNHPVGKWFNTGTYHNLHHERFDGNYGLYFTWWDRWMGTMREESSARFEAVTR